MASLKAAEMGFYNSRVVRGSVAMVIAKGAANVIIKQIVMPIPNLEALARLFADVHEHYMLDTMHMYWHMQVGPTAELVFIMETVEGCRCQIPCRKECLMKQHAVKS